jgi:hypothetical protein
MLNNPLFKIDVLFLLLDKSQNSISIEAFYSSKQNNYSGCHLIGSQIMGLIG